ncbi:MAG: AbrB/MazE/SpoVT family DNA-binding domain-containing protein [Candidatus Binatia bacterium]
MASSTVTRKGQVTIPAEVRKRLGLRRGDRVVFVEEDDRVVLRPAENDVEAAFGLVRAKKSVSLRRMDEVIRSRAGR